MTEDTTEPLPAVDPIGGGQDLRRRLVEILGEVRGDPVDELWDEALKLDCMLEMDSKEAEVVIARLEHEVGRDLAKPEDLEPEQLATVEAVASLVERSLALAPASPGQGG